MPQGRIKLFTFVIYQVNYSLGQKQEHKKYEINIDDTPKHN